MAELRRSARLALIGLLGALALSCGATASAAEPQQILVLYENSRLLPANVQTDQGLNEAIGQSNKSRTVDAEFLDYPRFGGEEYVQSVIRFLTSKYRTQPPNLIVAAGPGALRFILNNRSRFFPTVPVVHMGVSAAYLTENQPIPDDVVGIPIAYDFAGTIEDALRLSPTTQHLVMVTGASPNDLAWEKALRSIVPRFEGRLEIENLAGLPTAAVLKRLGELGRNTVVFTPGYFRDGAGRGFAPRDAVREMAEAATAPIFGPFDTFIGTGIVGGRMPEFTSTARETGKIISRILDGEPPATLQLPAAMPTTLIVDWGQIRRWGLDEAIIPRDAIVRFKIPTFWELYGRQVTVAGGVTILLSVLLTGLMIERSRRRGAETSVNKYQFELAHASRLAIAGELTASIAHEINQPLGAIESNVSAAEMMLATGKNVTGELRLILGDIHRDNIRASQVIRRLRGLLVNHEVERKIVDLSDVLTDVAAILRPEAQRRRVILSCVAKGSVQVVGDQIQIQQVLINLALNAIEAVQGMHEGRRMVNISVENSGGVVAITVRDRGPGIAPENLHKLFEFFFTTKRAGMGLGLSIVRRLVTALGGRVWAENGSPDGATFRIDLPGIGGFATTEK